MTNEELVNNIICKNCKVPINSTRPCDVFDKEHCFIYSSALRVANEKDKLLKISENELKQLRELEDYCSYEVSNLLSKKGFDYELNTFYKRNDNNKELQITLGFYGNYNRFNIPAPTHQMALKWLREIHKIYIYIYIDICELDNTPRYYIYIINKTDKRNPRSVYMDYYKAVDDAIKFVLEHLIN